MGFLSSLFGDGLHLAVKRGDMGKVKQLLADGSDPNEKRLRKTPLMIAARSANVEATTLLLENGVELEAKDRQGSTALMLAAGGWGYEGQDKEGKCLEVVKALLQKGSDPNVCGKRGQTAMRYALGAGNRRVMKVLHRHGATDSCYASVSTLEPSSAEPSASH